MILSLEVCFLERRPLTRDSVLAAAFTGFSAVLLMLFLDELFFCTAAFGVLFFGVLFLAAGFLDVFPFPAALFCAAPLIVLPFNGCFLFSFVVLLFLELLYLL
jgi:hypothetical protein